MVIVHYVRTELSTWMNYYSNEQYFTIVGLHNTEETEDLKYY